MSDFEKAVDIYLAEINDVFVVNYVSDVNLTKVKAVYARNYVKIVRSTYDRETGKENDMSASVYCFIVKKEDDKKFKVGDILKASGWKAPARNFARGNVFAVDYFPISAWGM